MEFCKQIKVFFLCTDHCTPVQYCAANTLKKNILRYTGILFMSHYKRKKCIKMKNLEYFSHSSLPVAYNLTIADFPLGLGESNSNLSWLLVIKNLKYYM